MCTSTKKDACPTTYKAAQLKLGVHGMNWITQQKRLAIYMRDNFKCVYCGNGINAGLTLDHITCRVNGGTNHEHNLITACEKCNCSRGDRELSVFVAAVAQYIDYEAANIMEAVKTQSTLPLDTKTAKAFVLQHGSCAKALQAIRAAN